MTAELFIKLAAQLYGDGKGFRGSDSDSETESPESSTPEKLSSAASEEYLREHRESDGGVNVNSEENLIDLELKLDLDDSPDAEGEVKTQQWLPKMGSKFWANYVNKLRVNASEEGVCDLAERDDDDNDEDVRRQL
jgi:poly(A)-specific ribonuclease